MWPGHIVLKYISDMSPNEEKYIYKNKLIFLSLLCLIKLESHIDGITKQ